MKKRSIGLIFYGVLLFCTFMSTGVIATPNMTCEEIGPDFYRCVATNMCTDNVNWSAPDDILVYPAGGVGSTMGLIQDRDVNGCIVAVASDPYSSARHSTCSGITTVSGSCPGDPGDDECPGCPVPPEPRVTCEEIEPDFYRCVAENMGEGPINWTAPDDILVYPSGGVGSTMALIRDRDINGCIVAVAEGTNGSARFRSCVD